MDYPRDFRTARPNTSGLGHQESGRNVAIHSLAVHPKLQGCGLGKLIMKSYMQQINNSGTADRLSLIAQEVSVVEQEIFLRPHPKYALQYLVNYYVRFGFKNKGPSKATFGGGGWNDMVSRLLVVTSNRWTNCMADPFIWQVFELAGPATRTAPPKK